VSVVSSVLEDGELTVRGLLSRDLLRMDQNQPEALYYRGLCLYYNGNHPQAIAHCQSALRNDPDFTLARFVALICALPPRVLTRHYTSQNASAEGQAARLAQRRRKRCFQEQPTAGGRRQVHRGARRRRGERCPPRNAAQ
jgi:tetratricopeptide (TPR) repeat protein